MNNKKITSMHMIVNVLKKKKKVKENLQSGQEKRYI